MSEHEHAEDYVSAMILFDKHLHPTKDGTLELDTEDHRSMGIDDPIIFADLKRSLDVTNRKIRNGEIKPEQINRNAF